MKLKVALNLAVWIATASALLLFGADCVRNQTIPPVVTPTDNRSAATVLYPHSADWSTLHGGEYLNNANACTTCHGGDLEGGPSKISCSKCHTSYPHRAKLPGIWARPENHGAALSAILDGINANGGDTTTNECLWCHKPPAATAVVNPKSASNIQCNACHVAVPHTSSKITTRDGVVVKHKVFGNDLALKSACLNCHRPKPDGNQMYMPNSGTCQSCHNSGDATPRVKWMSKDESAKVDSYLDQLRNGDDSSSQPPPADTPAPTASPAPADPTPAPSATPAP